MKKDPHILNGQLLTPFDLRTLLRNEKEVSLGKAARREMEASRAVVEHAIDSGTALYGINTGFGDLCNVVISHDQLKELQLNLIRSHASGVGEPAPSEVARLTVLLKAQTFARGYCGIRPIVCERLLEIYSKGFIPYMPSQGSVGASGDLAPLAHMSLLLIGEGSAYYKGKLISGKRVLRVLQSEPLVLEPKEGLSLINGTQFSTASGLYVLFEAERLLRLADVVAAFALEGFACHVDPFDPLIQRLKPHKGQIRVAARIRELRKGSAIAASEKTYVQDPYSFRCIPQVLGAVGEVFSSAREALTVELNAVTDNPIVSAKKKKILSGGNFHAEAVALQLDALTIALTETGTLFERMLAQLISGKRNLPAFLASAPGLHSGLMIAQCTAAALVGENQSLSSPVAVTNVSTSNNQEDHVSMAPYAAQKCAHVLRNIENILAITFFAAAEALEYRHENTSPILGELRHEFRQTVPRITNDRIFAEDIARTLNFLRGLNNNFLGKELL